MRYAVWSSKYSTGKSVVVPSHAAGVKIGGVRQDEAAIVEEVADGVDDLVAHAEDRLLPLGANPQVPAIEQVVDAVLLRRDRIVVRLADDLEVAARQARSRSARACPARTVPVTMIEVSCERWSVVLNSSVADVGLRHDALDEARAVAHRSGSGSCRSTGGCAASP